MRGNPVVKGGKIWDHLDDITNALRGLNGRIRTLDRLIKRNTFSGGALDQAQQLRSNLQNTYDSYVQALQREANKTQTTISVKKSM